MKTPGPGPFHPISTMFMASGSAWAKASLFYTCFICVVVTREVGCDTEIIQVLQNDKVERFTFNASQTIQFELRQLENLDISYAVLQVHTQWQEMSVSLDENFSPGSTVQGSNVGALSLLLLGQDTVVWFVKAAGNVTSGTSVSALVLANLGIKTEPIPGGCNMEYPLEYDPNVHLVSSSHISSVRFQYASRAVPRGGFIDTCENKAVQETLEYRVYQIYLDERDHSEEHYLNKMEAILAQDPETLTSTNKQLATVTYGKSRTSVGFPGYPGQGAIYVVTVQQTVDTTVTYSAYIPTATYSCTWQDGKCIVEDNVAVQVLAVLLGILGLFWCFRGHRFFKFAMFMAGYITFLLIFVITFTASTHWGTTAIVLGSAVLGLVGGSLWWCVWFFMGIPPVAMLIPGILVGLMAASLVFNYTPFGLLGLWQNSFNFGMAFSCALLIPPALLLAFTKVLSVLSCAILGSYLVVFSIDVFMHGSVRFIMMNTVLKAAVPDYITTVSTVPFQLSDVILCTLWAVLIVAGFTIQWWCERGRNDFPLCPWETYKARRSRQQAEDVSPVNSEDGDDERTPLLYGAGPSNGRPRLETSTPPVVDPI